jgi:hypothetical protein
MAEIVATIAQIFDMVMNQAAVNWLSQASASATWYSSTPTLKLTISSQHTSHPPSRSNPPLHDYAPAKIAS